jgi:hypothetical protein
MKTILKAQKLWILGLTEFAFLLSFHANRAHAENLFDFSNKIVEAGKKESIDDLKNLGNDLDAEANKKSKTAAYADAQTELSYLKLKAEVLSSIQDKDLQDIYLESVNAQNADLQDLDKQQRDANLKKIISKNNNSLLNAEVTYQELGQTGPSTQRSLKLNSNAVGDLFTKKPEMKKVWDSLSAQDKKDFEINLNKELNSLAKNFTKSANAEAFKDIKVSDDVNISDDIAAIKKHVEEIGVESKDPLKLLAVAQRKLDAASKDEQIAKDNIEKKKSILSAAKELIMTNSLKNIDACDLLKAGKISWDDLSDSDKKSCESNKDSFIRSVASTKDESKKHDALPAMPSGMKATNDDSKEEKKSKASKEQANNRERIKAKEDGADKKFNREAADQLSSARQMNEFLVAKDILNQIVLGCERANINNTLPMAANNLQIQKLDKLNDAMMSQPTSCTTSSYVSTELGGFGAGEALAEEALSEIYPKGAIGLSAEEANELPKERKCLARAMKSSLDKLNAANYYIRQHAWKLANIEIMQMMRTIPNLLEKKQQEMLAMGDTRNPMVALKEDLQAQKTTELEQMYDVDKMRRDHSLFRSLFSGVNQLYSARSDYVQNTMLKANENNENTLPVRASQSGSRVSPSRGISSKR